MDEPEVVEQNEQERSGGKNKKKLLFLIIGVVVIAAGVVGALFAFGIIGGGDAGEDAGDAAVAAPQTAKPVVALPTVVLESFVVNLSDKDQNHFLKTTIAIELANEAMVAEIEKRKEKIKDAVITLLSGKSVQQVRDGKGKLKLKQEITLRLNEILGANSVSEVLFTEFIIS